MARPDLLGGEEEARRAATSFCHTIQRKILSLPDHVEVFPTHGAGSLCGGNIGSRLSTTVGYERLQQRDPRSGLLLRGVRGGVPAAGQPAGGASLLAADAQHNVAGVERLGVLGEPPALQPAR